MVELADLAGLDVSTVSRALRGDARRVSATTITKVQELARRVGYLPDANAASLRRRHSLVVGVLVPDLTDVVLAKLVEAVVRAADAEGYLALVTSTHGVPGRRHAAVQSYLSRRVDGVIVADATLRHSVPDALASSNTPFVMALRTGGAHPAVVADDVEGGRLAAEHLVGRGHRAICVVAGPRNVSTAENRLRGFLARCARSGVSIGDDAVRHGGFGVEDGYRAMRELLDAGNAPSAVFAVNDYNAVGAARAMQERGSLVGRDTALVGYNDIALGAFLETPLTTVRVDHGAMGTAVVGLLVRRIRGEPVESVRIRPELVVRASSDAPMARLGDP